MTLSAVTGSGGRGKKVHKQRESGHVKTGRDMSYAATNPAMQGLPSTTRSWREARKYSSLQP